MVAAMSQHLYLPVMLLIAGFCFFIAHSRRKARQGVEVKQNYWVVGTGVALIGCGCMLLGVFLAHVK